LDYEGQSNRYCDAQVNDTPVYGLKLSQPVAQLFHLPSPHHCPPKANDLSRLSKILKAAPNPPTAAPNKMPLIAGALIWVVSQRAAFSSRSHFNQLSCGSQEVSHVPTGTFANMTMIAAAISNPASSVLMRKAL
jgi:hypothetical protein